MHQGSFVAEIPEVLIHEKKTEFLPLNCHTVTQTQDSPLGALQTCGEDTKRIPAVTVGVTIIM